MWKDVQGAMQVEGAHQNTFRYPYISLRILWQRTEEPAKLESSHVHSRPQERVLRLRQILFNSSNLEHPPERQTRDEHLELFIKTKVPHS